MTQPLRVSRPQLERAGFFALVALLQWLAWHAYHADNFVALTRASASVLEGTPHWRAYQNRLLGPALVAILGQLLANPLSALAGLTLLAGNLGLSALVRDLPTRRVRIALVVATTVWLVGMHLWTYPWDLVEMLCLLMLSHLVASQARTAAYVWLFLVYVTTRESALIVPVFLLVSALFGPRDRRRDRACVGGILLVIGVAYVQLSRDLLFRSSSWGGVGLDAGHQGVANHFALAGNARALWACVTQGRDIRPFTLFFALLLLFAIATVRAYRAGRRDLQVLCALCFAYVLSCAAFGLLVEARIFQPFAFAAAYLAVATAPVVDPTT